MADGITITVEYDPSILEQKMKSRYKAAQVMLDEAVIKDTDPYVRYQSGTLARSVQLASKVGEGEVTYDTPYAKRVYYDKKSHATRDIHPLATPLWLEASKRANIGRWTETVRKILAGGNA